MVSYLGSLVRFSPAAERAGRCRQKALCVGSTRRVLATLGLPRTGVSVLSPSTLLRLPACSIGSVLRVACSSSFRVLHKSTDLVALAFCAFPGLSCSGSQELEGRTLPGCSAPSPLRGPGLSFCARGSGASGFCLFSGAGL